MSQLEREIASDETSPPLATVPSPERGRKRRRLSQMRRVTDLNLLGNLERVLSGFFGLLVGWLRVTAMLYCDALKQGPWSVTAANRLIRPFTYLGISVALAITAMLIHEGWAVPQLLKIWTATASLDDTKLWRSLLLAVCYFAGAAAVVRRLGVAGKRTGEEKEAPSEPPGAETLPKESTLREGGRLALAILLAWTVVMLPVVAMGTAEQLLDPRKANGPSLWQAIPLWIGLAVVVGVAGVVARKAARLSSNRHINARVSRSVIAYAAGAGLVFMSIAVIVDLVARRHGYVESSALFTAAVLGANVPILTVLARKVGYWAGALGVVAGSMACVVVGYTTALLSPVEKTLWRGHFGLYEERVVFTECGSSFPRKVVWGMADAGRAIRSVLPDRVCDPVLAAIYADVDGSLLEKDDEDATLRRNLRVDAVRTWRKAGSCDCAKEKDNCVQRRLVAVAPASATSVNGCLSALSTVSALSADK